jgi:hypothetical protein
MDGFHARIVELSQPLGANAVHVEMAADDMVDGQIGDQLRAVAAQVYAVDEYADDFAPAHRFDVRANLRRRHLGIE